MMKNRSELREIIMKVLYQVDILKDSKVDYDIDSLIKEQLEVQNDFVMDTLESISKKEQEIEALANKHLIDWQVSRLNKVDKAILFLGIYELVYTNTPSVVAINEALELSKKYCDEKFTKLLNGVLDNIYHSEDVHE